jgi:hypothetical protein
MMTRKDYNAFAEAIDTMRGEIGSSEYELLVSRIAGVLADDNPNFDLARFERACGLHYIR